MGKICYGYFPIFLESSLMKYCYIIVKQIYYALYAKSYFLLKSLLFNRRKGLISVPIKTFINNFALHFCE